VVGKYVQLADAYKSVIEALEHGGFHHEVEVEVELIDSENFDPERLEGLDGILIPGGFGERGIEGKVAAQSSSKLSAFHGISDGLNSFSFAGITVSKLASQAGDKASPGFWLMAASLLLFMAASIAPSPLYVVYQAEWHFSTPVLSLIYATYAIGVLVSLLLVGSLSDQAGRKPVLAVALGAAALSTLAFIFAPDEGVLLAGRIRRAIGSYFTSNPDAVRAYEEGELEVELVPQGTLAEAIRAGGAGIGAFYVRTGVGTSLAEGHEVREIAGESHLLQLALTADVALIRAWRADRAGNLVFRRTARNFNPDMATAATLVIAEVDEIVPVGKLDPEAIVTPHVYVDALVLSTEVLR